MDAVHAPKPVSYTHLDVYKRQIPERADEDQKKSPDGLHDELIDSAVDIGYTCLLYTSRR